MVSLVKVMVKFCLIDNALKAVITFLRSPETFTGYCVTVGFHRSFLTFYKFREVPTVYCIFQSKFLSTYIHYNDSTSQGTTDLYRVVHRSLSKVSTALKDV